MHNWHVTYESRDPDAGINYANLPALNLILHVWAADWGWSWGWGWGKSWGWSWG